MEYTHYTYTLYYITHAKQCQLSRPTAMYAIPTYHNHCHVCHTHCHVCHTLLHKYTTPTTITPHPDPLTRALNEGFVLVRGEKWNCEFPEVCLHHTGHRSNINLTLGIGQRVPPCEGGAGTTWLHSGTRPTQSALPSSKPFRSSSV